MRRAQFRTIALPLGILFIAWVLVGFINAGPGRDRRKSDYIFPSPAVQHFTFGFNEVTSDSYWIRLLQDFNVCVNPKAAEDAPRTGLNRQAHCELDWGYHMLEVIIVLTPRNLTPYFVGGNMLSVVLDDIQGATRIYDKAVAAFPNEWELNFQAATHFMSEVGDLHKAGYLYNRAVENGGPGWISALSAKVFDKVGRTELGIINLKAQLKRAPNEKFAEAVQRKLVELEDKLRQETSAPSPAPSQKK